MISHQSSFVYEGVRQCKLAFLSLVFKLTELSLLSSQIHCKLRIHLTLGLNSNKGWWTRISCCYTTRARWSKFPTLSPKHYLEVKQANHRTLQRRSQALLRDDNGTCSMPTIILLLVYTWLNKYQSYEKWKNVMPTVPLNTDILSMNSMFGPGMQLDWVILLEGNLLKPSNSYCELPDLLANRRGI